MSKKKIYSKHLEKGRFYIHSDGHGGHPAILYKKRDNKIYILLLFSHLLMGLNERNWNAVYNQTRLKRHMFITCHELPKEKI